MNINRREFIFGFAGTGLVVSGCSTIPTADVIRTASKGIGKAVGYLCVRYGKEYAQYFNSCMANNQFMAGLFPIDDDCRDTLLSLMNKVEGCIPGEGETYEQKWSGVAKNYLASLVDQDKISQLKSDIVYSLFSIVLKGVYYLFTVRYPIAKTYTELTIAGIDGFIDGFRSMFCDTAVVKSDSVGVDKEALKYLMEKCPAGIPKV